MSAENILNAIFAITPNYMHENDVLKAFQLNHFRAKVHIPNKMEDVDAKREMNKNKKKTKQKKEFDTKSKNSDKHSLERV